MQSNRHINHSINVGEDINNLFLNDKLSDVVFVVDGKQIAAHKAVLAARSPTFMDMFQALPVNCKREIHIKDCSALWFKNFIKYIYSGKISLNEANEQDIEELLALALKYQMRQLAEILLEANNDHKRSHQNVKQVVKNLTDDQTIAKPTTSQELTFEDIANVNNGAMVVEGINPERLFERNKDFDEKLFTKHKIDVESEGIVIRLTIPVILNVIKFRLLDIEPKRHYSYYIQVSVNNFQWTTVADYRNYSCRSWQILFFTERLVQYIRIVGTHSNEKTFFSNTQYFTIISFMCGLTHGSPKLYNGLWKPETNVATLANGAVVVLNSKEYILSAKMINNSNDLEFKKYHYICSEFQFNKDSELIVQLSQPIFTSSVSFYIYGENRFKYTVKISINSIDDKTKYWRVVAKKQTYYAEPKWQKFTFFQSRVLLISISNIKCLDENVSKLPILAFSCP